MRFPYDDLGRKVCETFRPGGDMFNFFDELAAKGEFPSEHPVFGSDRLDLLREYAQKRGIVGEDGSVSQKYRDPFGKMMLGLYIRSEMSQYTLEDIMKMDLSMRNF